jgi:hypothetical protein
MPEKHDRKQEDEVWSMGFSEEKLGRGGAGLRRG